MKECTFIYTIRHAKTEFNARKRYAGSIDIPLSEDGRKECECARGALTELRFDAVITSTLRRTADTARSLLGSDIILVQSDLCVERNFGLMQGLTVEEVEQLEPRIHYIKIGGDFHSLNPPGGESFEDVAARAEKFRAFILDNYQGSSILVVSHGVFLQLFHGVLRGRDWTKSLARTVPNLALGCFQLLGRDLINETTTFLIDSNGIF